MRPSQRGQLAPSSDSHDNNSGFPSIFSVLGHGQRPLAYKCHSCFSEDTPRPRTHSPPPPGVNRAGAAQPTSPTLPPGDPPGQRRNAQAQTRLTFPLKWDFSRTVRAAIISPQFQGWRSEVRVPAWGTGGF